MSKFQEQFQNFLSKHPNGKISKRSFLSMMKECYPSKDSDRIGRHIWRMYDVNEVRMTCEDVDER